MLKAVIAGCMAIGMFFILMGAIGIVRMPDLYMRLSASAKASTLGTAFLLFGAAFFFREGSVTGQVIAIVIFIVLTTPVAAHMIGRAAYFDKVPLWKESVHDDLRHTTGKESQKANAGAGSRNRNEEEA